MVALLKSSEGNGSCVSMVMDSWKCGSMFRVHIHNESEMRDFLKNGTITLDLQIQILPENDKNMSKFALVD